MINTNVREYFFVDEYEQVTLRKGWARAFVEAEERIPQEWRDNFIDELTSQDQKYRSQLEESIRWHGVRWA